MRRVRVVISALLCLAVAGADAKPLMVRGGTGTGIAPAPSTACDTGATYPDYTKVCASVANGQTRVTWPDAATGALGNNFRYRMYRSTSALNSGNCTSGTLIAKYIFNNSGQLVGGNPDTGGATFTQTNRQDPGQPMVKMTDLGTAIPVYTGLQGYTALANENAYYCIVSTTTTDTSPSYIGAAGPVGESVATPQLIKYLASGSRLADPQYGTFNGNCASGCPIVFRAHQSSAAGGAPSDSQTGDYWWGLGTAAEGFQDGRQMAVAVHQDGSGGTRYPSLTNSLEVSNMGSWWNGLGTGAIETWHFGVGLTPNPLVGPANRLYRGTALSAERFIRWVASHYNADLNQFHWRGESLGAWGAGNTAIRQTNPEPAAFWVSMPIWRFDRKVCTWWPGTTWQPTDPFRATLDTGGNGCYLGTSNVLMSDGTRWDGDGNYADTPHFIATSVSADLPAAIWMQTKDDTYPASYLEQVEAMAAFETSHHFYATCWFMGEHDTGAPARGLIDYDWASNSLGYRKDQIRLDRMLPAFSNSSINDNPGTGVRDGNGIYDGDTSGCANVGFSWNVTSDTAGALNFTVDNAWMDQTPTADPTTTTTASIASPSATGSVTLTSGAALNTGSAYFQIDNEILYGSIAGNTFTYTARGWLGTTGATHSAGATIKQFLLLPTGPNGGPYSTMTVDITPRRIQGFTKGHTNGQTVSCTITPNGGSPATQTPTVANNYFTLTVTINVSGATDIACS